MLATLTTAYVVIAAITTVLTIISGSITFAHMLRCPDCRPGLDNKISKILDAAQIGEKHRVGFVTGIFIGSVIFTSLVYGVIWPIKGPRLIGKLLRSMEHVPL